MRVSAIERFAFGRPLSATEDGQIHVAERSGTALVGRILLGAIFVLSGVGKLTALGPTAAYMTSAGIPAAHALATVAGIAEVAGGLAIMFGLLTRPAAIGLIVFMIPTTLMFHDFWSYSGAEAKTQMINFMKNLAIIGGLATLVAHGAGGYSLDGRIRSPKQA